MIEEGIILKTTPYKESSKILHILTEKGISSVLARGALKLSSPFRNEANNFTLVSFEAAGKNFLTLQNMEVINNYQSIKTSLKKNACAASVSDFLFHMNLDGNEAKIFSFSKKILNAIDKFDEDTSLMVFKLKMLFILGVNPSFKCCSRCDNTVPSGFSIKEGSIVCENHSGLKEVSLELTKLLSYLYYINLDKEELPLLTEEEKKSLMGVINAYYNYHVGFISKITEKLNQKK